MSWHHGDVRHSWLSNQSKSSKHVLFKKGVSRLKTKKVSEYYQEIPQSQTADKPMAS